MEREKLEGMMIEYVDGTLNEDDRKRVEELIANDPAAAKLHEQIKEILYVLNSAADVEPSFKMKANFERLLKEEKQKASKVISFSVTQVYRIAAGIALVVSVGLAAYWFQERRIERLVEKMEETKTHMMAMLQNRGSAGQRLQGVSVSMTIQEIDDDIVNALVNTLDTDPNTNVRLAALDALARFHEQPHVRTELVSALRKQTDPSVQIALIRLLVEIKAKDSLKELERISTDELILPAVQDEAHAGILKLS